MQQKVPFTGPLQQKVPFTGLAPKLFPSWCQTAFCTTSLKPTSCSCRLTLGCARLSLTATSSFFFLCAGHLSLLALWPKKSPFTGQVLEALLQDHLSRPSKEESPFAGHHAKVSHFFFSFFSCMAASNSLFFASSTLTFAPCFSSFCKAARVSSSCFPLAVPCSFFTFFNSLTILFSLS